MDKQKNRREYFRYAFPIPLCGEVSVAKVNNRTINSKKAHVCIRNMGGGGLLFESHLDFPCVPDLFLQFVFVLQEKEIEVQGILNRKEFLSTGIFQYGVTFQMGTQEQQELIRLINAVAIKGKRM